MPAMDKPYLCRDCGNTNPKNFERRRHTHCNRCRITAYRHTNTPAPVEPPPLATGDPSITQAAINVLCLESKALYSMAGRRPPHDDERQRIRAIACEVKALQEMLRRQLAVPRQLAHEKLILQRDGMARLDLEV